MRLFSRREPLPVAPSRPEIDEIFREDLGFIAGALLHFGIAPIDVEDAAHEVIRAVLMSLSSFDPSRDHESLAGGTRPRSRRHFIPASLSLPFVRVPS